MKGLNKYIINSIIDHARVYDFEQLLFLSRHVEKDFGGVLIHIKIDAKRIKLNAYSLRRVKYQTRKLCLYAVRTFGMCLEAVKEKTYEISLEAVKKDGLALKYVKEKTYEICVAAIENNPHSLDFIENQTEELCLKAVRIYGTVLKLVRNQTQEICNEAVKENTWTFIDVKEIYKTYEMCIEVVKKDRRLLNFVPEFLRKYLFK
jgi:hypothetical protein